MKKFFGKTAERKTDEWVWIEGFKGTDKDMKCNDFQYEIGKTYSMLKESVSMCMTGFHLCKELCDVWHYYNIGRGNRFFKVRALVKQSDLSNYGQPRPDYGYFLSGGRYYDKLVAAEIEFLEELSVDEILKTTDAADWDDKYKKLAIDVGVRRANEQMLNDILTDLGYNNKLARYIIRKGLFDIAEAVGSQSDLSMDVKVKTIFNVR